MTDINICKRDYNFRLLLSYWKNKRHFPNSSINLDTTIGDIISYAGA